MSKQTSLLPSRSSSQVTATRFSAKTRSGYFEANPSSSVNRRRSRRGPDNRTRNSSSRRVPTLASNTGQVSPSSTTALRIQVVSPAGASRSAVVVGLPEASSHCDQTATSPSSSTSSQAQKSSSFCTLTSGCQLLAPPPNHRTHRAVACPPPDAGLQFFTDLVIPGDHHILPDQCNVRLV